MRLKGWMTELVTPFRDGKIDQEAFRALVDWQIEQGVNGLVPAGTSGENSTLSRDEHRSVVAICIEQSRGRVPVIADASSNQTLEAVRMARQAEQGGAAAVLVVTPYYNKPGQEGLVQHFKAINDAIGIPIIMHNNQPRSIIDMSVDTMKRLFELRNIAGVMDSTVNVGRISLQRHALGPDFIQLAGDDMTALASIAAGARGCISVTSNVAPRACVDLFEAVDRGDLAAALRVQDRLTPLHAGLLVESGVSGAKYGLSALERLTEEVRLPLTPMTDASKAIVRNALTHAGLYHD